MKIDKIIVIAFLVLAFITRIITPQFPVFAPDEARIAFRAYALSATGKDELGRNLPFLFNSMEDYQLPVVSYVAAFGVLIFGKTDLGVRVPFILIGTVVVFLIYKLSGYFFEDKRYGYYAAVVASLSPGLIFYSKFPNEFIIATFLILLLIIQTLSEKVSNKKILIIILLMLLTSRMLMLTLIPVLILSLFLNNKIQRKEKIILFALGFIPAAAALFFYLNIPQGARSLAENNFSILSDVNVKNGIEKLRSQIAPGWPSFFDRMLFNKAYFVLAGIFHWFSGVSLSRLFTELDQTGNFGYLKSGAFSKIVIIPFLVGLFILIRENRRIKYLLLFVVFVTFPLIFLYPAQKTGYIIPALPFIALIAGSGFKFLNKKSASILVILLFLEFIINLLFTGSSVKNANEYRQSWIRQPIEDAYAYSVNYDIAFSDNITQDMVPLIEWYTKFDPADAYEKIPYPYKFRQAKILNYKIIGSNDTFYNCGLDKNTYIFASRRDLDKIQRDIKVSPADSYKDLSGRNRIYLLPPKICVR